MVKIKKENLNLSTVIIFALIISLFFAEQVQAEKKKESDKKTTETTTSPTTPVTASKTITGEIGVIRDTYIIVIYKQDKRADGTTIKDYEMVLPIDENITLSHIKSIGQLNEGDKVQIRYDETSWIDEKGVGRIERRGKHIRFIKPAIKGLRSQ